MDYKLKWLNDVFPPNREEVEAQIIKDLEHYEIDNPKGLFFHTVFLGEGIEKDYKDEPIVVVCGSETEDFFECIYDTEPKWTSFGDLEKEENESKSN